MAWDSTARVARTTANIPVVRPFALVRYGFEPDVPEVPPIWHLPLAVGRPRHRVPPSRWRRRGVGARLRTLDWSQAHPQACACQVRNLWYLWYRGTKTPPDLAFCLYHFKFGKWYSPGRSPAETRSDLRKRLYHLTWYSLRCPRVPRICPGLPPPTSRRIRRADPLGRTRAADAAPGCC